MTRWGLTGKGKPLAFILLPSADGVQDSREWPELVPICSYLALIGEQFSGREQTALHVASGCTDLPRAKGLFLRRRPRAVRYASGSGSRVLEVCQVARELAAGPGAPRAGAQREGRELAPGNSPPNQEASEARLLGLRTR